MPSVLGPEGLRAAPCGLGSHGRGLRRALPAGRGGGRPGGPQADPHQGGTPRAQLGANDPPGRVTHLGPRA